MMTAREFDPFRLDVVAFAKEAGELAGRWPLALFDRIAESAVAGAPVTDADEVSWSVRGERRELRGGDAQTWLHVEAATHVSLECQRCLKPVDVALRIARNFLFVHGEDAAAQLDADSEDDVLAITRALDLRELIEDELLLGMPIVPRHEVCPEPLVAAADDEVFEDKPNPFAALATIKRSGLN
jgi:uncharacterized protein